MSGPITLTLTAAERTELLKNPESFARRAESVLTAMVQKLQTLDAAMDKAVVKRDANGEVVKDKDGKVVEETIRLEKPEDE